jgi:hypothetical protein
MTKRAAIYVRVSTDKQTIENQLRELRQIAQRRGWQVVEEYHDAVISAAKGRKDRPGLDRMLHDAQRRRFDVVMAWAIDRLGRSLIDRPLGYNPGPGGLRRRSVPRPAGDRYDHPGRKADVSGHGRFCRV